MSISTTVGSTMSFLLGEDARLDDTAWQSGKHTLALKSEYEDHQNAKRTAELQARDHELKGHAEAAKQKREEAVAAQTKIDEVKQRINAHKAAIATIH